MTGEAGHAATGRPHTRQDKRNSSTPHHIVKRPGDNLIEICILQGTPARSCGMSCVCHWLFMLASSSSPHLLHRPRRIQRPRPAKKGRLVVRKERACMPALLSVVACRAVAARVVRVLNAVAANPPRRVFRSGRNEYGMRWPTRSPDFYRRR